LPRIRGNSFGTRRSTGVEADLRTGRLSERVKICSGREKRQSIRTPGKGGRKGVLGGENAAQKKEGIKQTGKNEGTFHTRRILDGRKSAPRDHEGTKRRGGAIRRTGLPGHYYHVRVAWSTHESFEKNSERGGDLKSEYKKSDEKRNTFDGEGRKLQKREMNQVEGLRKLKGWSSIRGKNALN